MTENEIRELLREMGSEPVPADSLRRVRLAVDARTQPRTRIWWRWAAALAAAVCVAVLIQWRRPTSVVRKTTPEVVAWQESVQPAPSPAKMPSRAPLPDGRGSETEPRALASGSRTKPVENKLPSAANVVIRIETPDPDVVILLIGD